MAKPVGVFQFFFQLNAACNGTFNKHTNEAFASGTGNEAVGFGVRHSENFSHFTLGFSTSEMQPSSARRESGFFIELNWGGPLVQLVVMFIVQVGETVGEIVGVGLSVSVRSRANDGVELGESVLLLVGSA